MNPFSSMCDDFYLTCYLNTELELPQTRDTLLHYFEQVGKAYPKMTNFYMREANEHVLEEDKDQGSYRWMTLEPRRIASGYFNPPDLNDCHAQNEMMLDLAPPILSVSTLDCEALDVMFGFDLAYKGNHDEIVGEAFAREGRFEGLLGVPGAKVVDYEPTITLALDEACKLQCRVSIVTRSNSYQIRTQQFGEEAISVYFTIRQYWGIGNAMTFQESYRKQFELGMDLVGEHVMPQIVVPLCEAISAR